MMKKLTTKELTWHAMFLALNTVTTMALAVPIIVTKGYVNLGDVPVILSGWLLGPIGGGIVGGMGSALADLLLGYGHYAPVTLLVKGIEGLLAGLLLHRLRIPVFSGLVAGLAMALGYFLAQLSLFGTAAALVEAPANMLQGAVGALCATVLYRLVKSIRKVVTT